MNIQPKDTSKGHFYVSLAKSGIRIAAGVSLIAGGCMWQEFGLWFIVAGILLIIAEAFGVVEELV